MEATTLRRVAIRRGYVCPSCVARRNATPLVPKRKLHASSPLRRQGVLEILEERGLVNQIAGKREILSDILAKRKVSVYAGVDPTAPSLHLGHLLPLMVLFWLHNHGHNTISLIGGGTAKIGDPSGRLTSRESLGRQNTSNTKKMMHQMKTLWERAELGGLKHGLEKTGDRQVMSNGAWLAAVDIVTFLKVLGRGMRVGTMLGRDTVRNKMEKGDGMSFAEFAYPLLQGWDWWHMYKTYGTQVQVGGADQYGNIVAGMEAVRFISQDEGHGMLETEKGSREPMGLTVPLLTTSSGEKFGKSAGNAMWLDLKMTTAFDLYGFLLKTSDADVEKYLKLFTFVPLKDISRVMKQHTQDPGKRIAQRLLASEVLELVHGVEEAESTKIEHERMRKPTLESVKRPIGRPQGATTKNKKEKVGPVLEPAIEDTSEQEIEENPGLGEQHVMLAESKVRGLSFAHVLHNASLAASKSEATRMINAGGVYVAQVAGKSGSQELDFVSVKGLNEDVKVEDLLIESQLILRLGKWKVRVIEVMDDELFDSDLLRA